MTADEGRCFVDTNIFIYAHDRSAGRRHEVAATLCRELWNARRGVVSTQVLQELYVNLRKKCVPAVERQLALEIVDDLRAWDVVAVEAADVIAAIELEGRHRISFWDALIVQAANRGEAEILYSEDLNDGQRFGEVVVRNPFRMITGR